jgi:hypothetical protein
VIQDMDEGLGDGSECAEAPTVVVLHHLKGPCQGLVVNTTSTQ